jgi:hypothetical protein
VGNTRALGFDRPTPGFYLPAKPGPVNANPVSAKSPPVAAFRPDFLDWPCNLLANCWGFGWERLGLGAGEVQALGLAQGELVVETWAFPILASGPNTVGDKFKDQGCQPRIDYPPPKSGLPGRNGPAHHFGPGRSSRRANVTPMDQSQPTPDESPPEILGSLPGEPGEGIGLASRVILHLSTLGQLGVNDLAMVESTQHGMVVALEVRQGSLVRVLRRLEAGEVIEVERRYVARVNRRLKVYRLTALGEATARDLRHPRGRTEPHFGTGSR